MRFWVKGVDRATGQRVKPLVIEGEDERDALATATAAGMLVESVQAFPPELPAPPLPPARPAASVPRSKGTRRWLSWPYGIASSRLCAVSQRSLEPRSDLWRRIRTRGPLRLQPDR